MLLRSGEREEVASARRAGPGPGSGGRARGAGGAGPGGRGARGPGGGGAVARAGPGGRSVTHAAGREAAAAARQAPPGRARACGLRRAPAASLRRSLALPPACSLAAGPGSPRRSLEGRRGAEDADKFPQQPRIPAKAEAVASTGQEGAPQLSARLERRRKGAPEPFSLRGAAGRDPMRRALAGHEIRSPGDARRRRKAGLQPPELVSGRQEAAERT